MTNNKTIGISALVSLGLILISMITPGLFNEPQYFCESRPELGLVQCDNFSKYVSEVGKCIRNDNTNLQCREGWLLVEDDTILPEEDLSPEYNTELGNQWCCPPKPEQCYIGKCKEE